MAADEADSPLAAETSVVVNDGRLWATFRDARLEDALGAIGDSAAFDVEILGELDRTVAASFDGEPVGEALRWLLQNISWVARVDPTGRISRLRVFGRPDGTVDGNAPPPPRNAESMLGWSEQRPDPAARRAKQDRLKNIMALGREQPDGAADVLASALADDADPAIRWNAAIALSEIPDDLAGAALADTLVDQAEDPRVRRLAAWALGKRQDKNLAWALRATASDPSDEVRQAARHALEAIHRPPGKDHRQQRMGRTMP